MSHCPPQADIVIVGGGNAALCAAMAAAAGGQSVVVLEAAAPHEAGGNSWFTDGAIRIAVEDEHSIAALLRLPAAAAQKIVVPLYPAARYLQDLQAAGGAQANPSLLSLLARRSYSTACWLRDNGVPLELISDNQAHLINGKQHFFGNLTVRAARRGIGLLAAQTARCHALGARIIYGARARALQTNSSGAVTGLQFEQRDEHSGKTRAQHITARAVVLACGGFEANAAMRAKHLGEEWRAARVRGTRHNAGDGLEMAFAAGAARAGDWRGCHAVGTDFNTPASGDVRFAGDIWKKHSYPYGLLLNLNGRRFADEGANLRNYTYAKYGREILRQPRGLAVQVFDAQTAPLLRSEYHHEHAARFQADTLPALAAQLAEAHGMHQDNFLTTLADYNAAVQPGDFNAAALDGKCTRGLAINKSNWALPLSAPPFLAYPVVCGITFTFGGVAINDRAAVLRENGQVISGLFAAGEMVGGLFGGNYPGGSGLMSGAVFGRLAGSSARRHASTILD